MLDYSMNWVCIKAQSGRMKSNRLVLDIVERALGAVIFESGGAGNLHGQQRRKAVAICDLKSFDWTVQSEKRETIKKGAVNYGGRSYREKKYDQE